MLHKKNDYETMVLMDVKQCSILTNNIEKKLDEADICAANTSTRLSKADVFDSVRRTIADAQALETALPAAPKTQ